MSTQVPSPSLIGVVRQVQPSAPSLGVKGAEGAVTRAVAHGSNVGSVNFDV